MNSLHAERWNRSRRAMDRAATFLSTDVVTVVWVVCVILLAASIQDLRTREVSDLFSVGLLVSAALVLCSRAGVEAGTGAIPPSLSLALIGLILGSVIGAMLFFGAKFGGGDAKLIAAIGACVGPMGLLIVLAWMALAGFVLSIIALMRQKKEIAYVPAIAFGAVVYAIDADLLARLIGM